MNNIPASYWSYLALALVLATLWMAYRFRSESILDGLQKLSGYTVTWFGLLFIFLIFFPLALRIIPIYMASQWQPVIAQYSTDGQDIAKNANGVITSTFKNLKGATYSDVPTGNESAENITQNSPSRPDDNVYIVQPGDTFNEIASSLGVDQEELAQLNATNTPNPALLEVGDEVFIPTSNSSAQNVPTPLPTIIVTLTNPLEAVPTLVETPAPPTPTPAPTPTATPNFLDEILNVEQLKADGQLFSATQILDNILDQNPDHLKARQLKEEAVKAGAVISQWQELHSLTKEDQELVRAVLTGYSFEIIANESLIYRSLWKETITIKSASPGWTYGTQFSLPRGHIYHLTNRHDPVGLVFEVE